MSSSPVQNVLKKVLGLLPASAKFYQLLRPGVVPTGSYALDQLGQHLGNWITAIDNTDPWVSENDRKHVLIMANLKWWLEYSVILGLLLKSGGHRVDIAYLPYRDWTTSLTSFDVMRGSYHMEQQLRGFDFPLGFKSLIAESPDYLNVALVAEIEAQTRVDVQYTMQREAIDIRGDSRDAAMYALRLERNRIAAVTAHDLLSGGEYDVVIIPNGSILEFGAVYRVARYLGVSTVTYEFGEQRQRVWLAQNDEVMRQDTSDLWATVKNVPLTLNERERIERLFQARRGGQTWEQFKRQWQTGGSEGAQQVRTKLGLDPERPIILLCTNVVADSLALNRQVFTDGMADWLAKTVAIFAEMPEYQLVVRVHPGEMLGAGHPSVEIVRDVLPNQPEHVIVVPPESEINTYDLIELAHLGLVYTTTVGLEMCMHGVPVITAGHTHYKGKGFTSDPQNWAEYTHAIREILQHKPSVGLSEEAVEAAWRYAYRFFFDYPFEFPWHLLSFWDDVSERPLRTILKPDKISQYIPTLNAFVGEPIDWELKVFNQRRQEIQVGA
jgi:hypothetical protein